MRSQAGAWERGVRSYDYFDLPRWVGNDCNNAFLIPVKSIQGGGQRANSRGGVVFWVYYPGEKASSRVLRGLFKLNPSGFLGRMVKKLFKLTLNAIFCNKTSETGFL